MIPTRHRGRNPWVVGVAIGVAIAVAFFVARHTGDAWRLARDARSLDPALAFAGLLLSGSAIVNRGLLNRAAHRAVGLHAGIGAMTQTAAVGFAAQKMVKSAGAAGLAVFVCDGRRRGHEPGAIAAACVLAAISSFVALGVLLVSAIGLLAFTGRLTGWWIAAAAGFGLYATGTSALGCAILRRRDLAVRAWSRARSGWSRIRRRPGAAPLVAAAPNAVFDALDTARTSGGALRLLLLHGIASKALGAAMLVTAVAAVGLPISPIAAVIVYATALGASMVTIVPGGVGPVEGSATALLVASGAPVASAALAVLVFRCLDLLVPVVVGAVAARGRVAASADPDPVEPLALPLAAAA